MKTLSILLSLLLLFSSTPTFSEEISTDFLSTTKLLYQGDFDRAISQFIKIIEESPSNTGAHHNLACAYALKGDYDRALKEFGDALELENTSFKTVILFDRAVIYFKKKMYQESLNDQDQAVKLISGVGKQENFFNLATVSGAISRHNAQFEKVNLTYNESSPELPDTVYFNSHALNSGGRNDYVFDDLNPPPLFFYQSRFARNFLGSSYIKQENYSEAEQQFQGTLNIEEQYGILDNLPIRVADYYLGQTSVLQKNYSQAIKYFKESVKLLPEPSYKYLSWVYFLNENYLEAKEACQSALNLKPDDEEAKGILDRINEKLSSQR